MTSGPLCAQMDCALSQLGRWHEWRSQQRRQLEAEFRAVCRNAPRARSRFHSRFRVIFHQRYAAVDSAADGIRSPTAESDEEPPGAGTAVVDAAKARADALASLAQVRVRYRVCRGLRVTSDSLPAVGTSSCSDAAVARAAPLRDCGRCCGGERCGSVASPPGTCRTRALWPIPARRAGKPAGAAARAVLGGASPLQSGWVRRWAALAARDRRPGC